MMRSLIFLALCLIANSTYAQLFEHELKVAQVSAITAKSASIEPRAERVAIFLADRDPGEQLGIEVYFTTTAKFAAVRVASNGQQQKVTRSTVRPNTWLMFGPPGKYSITAVESDPEKGLDFVDTEFEIKGTTAPPVNPGDPPQPPSGDFAAVTSVAKTVADGLSDPPTRAALVIAYTSSLADIAGKPYVDAQLIVKTARAATLRARKGKSLEVDWNSWLKAVDVEMAKFVPAGDAVKYTQAIEAIVKGLNQ